MTTPQSTVAQRNDKELAVIRPLAAIALLVLGTNFARHQLFLWALSCGCLAVGAWMFTVPVRRRTIDRVRRAHACFYAGMAFFVLQIVAMFLT